MPDLDAFEAQVKQNIKLLASKDVKARRQAARWLGEAGDPTAITSLSQAYKNDADPTVRENARYALGMFRKLEQELNGPNRNKTVKLLQDVALKGKMGGRSRLASRGLIKFIWGLLISAVLVAVMALVLPSVLKGVPSGGSGQANPPSGQNSSAGGQDRAGLLSTIRDTWTKLATDASTLQTQLQTAQNGSAMDCAAAFNNPGVVDISADNRAQFSDIAGLVDTLNGAQAALAGVKSAFDSGCTNGGQLAGDAAGAQITALQGMMALLPEIGQKLAAAESQSAPTVESIPATEAPTLTPEPAIEPTATVNIRQALLDLQAIIDNMTGTQGPSSILKQYWTEAKTSGTQGCSDQVPASAIPDNYSLPVEMQNNGDLSLAANLVNTGLESLRQARNLFEISCPSPGNGADRGLQFTEAANVAFTNAGNIIAGLRGGA